MIIAILILVVLLAVGFIRSSRSQKNQEIQEESSQAAEETPNHYFQIPDEKVKVDTSYFHREILPSTEPEEEDFERQGEVIPEPKPKKDPADEKASPKKSSTKKPSVKKTATKKTTSKKTKK